MWDIFMSIDPLRFAVLHSIQLSIKDSHTCPKDLVITTSRNRWRKRSISGTASVRDITCQCQLHHRSAGKDIPIQIANRFGLLTIDSYALC